MCEDLASYRRLIGKHNYLSYTRLDITFAVQFLNQFMSKPCKPHMNAALDTLGYLKLNPNQGILMNADSSFTLTVDYDSD